MEATERNSTWLVFLALGALLLLALLAMPLELPPLGQVKPRAHAVERHGEDAVAARAALANCKNGLKIKVCPPATRYGLSVYMWCESGAYLCPGCVTTIGGLEKTAFIRPCEDWATCR
uniref:Uncharacterized protein n=1 Tax=viral metagenome TaxID=1070528 RepID=A0A6M3M6E8_9ZZZZ